MAPAGGQDWRARRFVRERRDARWSPTLESGHIISLALTTMTKARPKTLSRQKLRAQPAPRRRPAGGRRRAARAVSPPADTWFAAMELRESGRLMLTNLLHAFRSQRLTEQTLAALLQGVLNDWANPSGRRPDAVVERFADRDPEHFLCQPPQAHSGSCSRVVDDVSFVCHNLDVTEAEGVIEDEIPADLLDAVERGLTEEHIRVNSQLGGRRPFAWVTRTQALRELRDRVTSVGELASTVRDMLGLSHYMQDHLLLEIEYPGDVVEALSLTAPTFIEGGSGVIFRARTSADGWGRAVDLRTHDDGLPEAVHPPVKLTPAFRVRRLGRITCAQGFVFQEVIRRSEHPWEGMPSDFRLFLERFGLS